MSTTTLMTKEEVLQRLEAGEDPMQLSIEKWERALAVAEQNPILLLRQRWIGASTCALCRTYSIPQSSCDGCPVEAVTGQQGCEGTPFGRVEDELDHWAFEEDVDPSNLRILIAEELAFLKLVQSKQLTKEPQCPT